MKLILKSSNFFLADKRGIIGIYRSVGAAYSSKFPKPTPAEFVGHYRDKLWN